MTLTGGLSADVDDAVEFEFTVTNTGTEPRELEFRSGQVADIVVRSGDDEAWRWSDGRMFTQALQTEMLPPGESLVFEGSWADPVRGTYEAVAALEATNANVEARAEFEV